ncbi:MAG TPA: 3-deoxy-manno-octulosonate cytidylyltransferase [Terriglobia bacterium]|nr:3-deoxy-manno-octulosonate cytidylyltransferase [Terriglobia bacterium]
MRIVAIIPARLASSRLPRKALLEIHGLPMVEHVRRRAIRCPELAEVAVATCDQEIADVVRSHGGNVVMTSLHHPGATDRVAEAMDHFDCTHVINVQGDEVLVLPEDLTRMVQSVASDPSNAAWNAVARIETKEELADPSIVKLVVSGGNRVLFCTRRLDHLKLNGTFDPVRKSIGVMAYSRPFLQRYVKLNRTPLEIAEAIDQSRIIEHDLSLKAVDFTEGYPSINEPREVPLVEKWLTEHPHQDRILREILI